MGSNLKTQARTENNPRKKIVPSTNTTNMRLIQDGANSGYLAITRLDNIPRHRSSGQLNLLQDHDESHSGLMNRNPGMAEL